MRWVRATLIALIAILTVGFQAAPGPYVLCVSQCGMDECEEQVEIVCYSGPAESGRCIVIEGGSCGPKAAEPSLPDFGCCVADASCPPLESCPQLPYDQDGCPLGQPECQLCLPGRVLADKAPQPEHSFEDAGRLSLETASVQLALADQAAQLAHAHAPPPLLASPSGSDICIEICLLLI